ncbi:SfnB family sulfur acquisition oxidoreductase, partial [Klebsiella pneumoniae]
CTGALYAQRVPTLAVDDEGRQQLAFVPRDSAGLEIVDDWSGFGQRTTASGTVLLDEVPVAGDMLIHNGLLAEIPSLQGAVSQLIQAAIDAGIARGILAETVQQVRRHARPWIDANQQHAWEDPYTIQQVGDLL